MHEFCQGLFFDKLVAEERSILLSFGKNRLTELLLSMVQLSQLDPARPI